MTTEYFRQFSEQNFIQSRRSEDFDIAVNTVIPLFTHLIKELKKDGSALPVKGKIAIALRKVLSRLYIHPTVSFETLEYYILEIAYLNNSELKYQLAIKSLEEQLSFFHDQKSKLSEKLW